MQPFATFLIAIHHMQALRSLMLCRLLSCSKNRLRN